MTVETLQTSAQSKAVPLHSRAEDNLQFIRDAMEGASSFTSISGIGLVGAGVVGLTASVVQGAAEEPQVVFLWLSALTLAFAFSTCMTIVKARRQGTSLWSVSGKKLLYAFTPTMFVGGVVTLYAVVSPSGIPLPAFWLSLYGAAIMTAGAYSIALLRIMGAMFIVLGIAAFFAPVSDRIMMGIGFGGFHIGCGLIIWKYHGG